jgi:flagellar hook-associated protein 2
MATSASSLFTGTSTYSSDFSQVIDRAVSIASLPIDQLNNQKTALTNQSTALSGLSASFSSLQATLYSLSSSVGNGSYATTYSDPTVASATVSPGALLGTYSIEVIDPGSRASAASTATVADPTTASISSATSFTLTANGQQYTITPADNTLTSLADAINTTTGGAAQATIVNLGSSSSPSYALFVQNSKYGTIPITLDDGSGNILGSPTAATPVQFRVNGQPAPPADPLTSDTRTLTIAPNVSVTVLAAGTTDINVDQNTSGIANAISGFVTAYNSATQAITAQRGSSGGALAGQSIITTLSQSLRSISNYTGTGALSSIADIGLTFDKNGVLSFDPSVLNAAADKDFKDITDFLGNATTGGFLKTATDTLSSLTDSTSGAISLTLTSIGGEITDVDNRISDNQDRVDQLKQNLTAQMAAADALIAQMQQQVIYMTNLFTAMTANQNSMK